MTMTLDNPTAVATATAQVRWNAALKALRSTGVKTKMNYSSCCRSCANLGEDPYIAVYGGQGNAYGWVDGVMFERNEMARIKRSYWSLTAEAMPKKSKIEKVYVEFNDLAAAEGAALAFAMEGFDVDWDGTEAKCIVVTMS